MHPEQTSERKGIAHSVSHAARHVSVRVAKDVKGSNKVVLLLFCRSVDALSAVRADTHSSSCLVIFLRALTGAGYEEGITGASAEARGHSAWAWRQFLRNNKGYEWAQSGSANLNHMMQGILDKVDHRLHPAANHRGRHREQATPDKSTAATGTVASSTDSDILESVFQVTATSLAAAETASATRAPLEDLEQTDDEDEFGAPDKEHWE